MMEIIESIKRHAGQQPYDTAIISSGMELTYKAFAHMIQLKVELYRKYREVGPIALIQNNSIELITSILAFSALRIPVLLLNTDWLKSEYEFYFSELGIKVILAEKYVAEKLLHTKGICYEEITDNLVKLERIGFNEPTLHPPKDTFVIKATSGSEGKSKLAVRSDVSVIQEICATCEVTDLMNSKIFLCLPPICHSFGLIAGCLLPLYYGKSVILLERFFPDDVVRILDEKKPDILFAVPSMYSMLLKALKKSGKKINCIQKAFSAGMKLSNTLLSEFHRVTGVWIINDYGSTETGVMCLNQQMEQYPDAVGKPLKGCEISCRNELGEEVPRHCEGEICFKSPFLSKGYLYPKGLSASKFFGAVYHTGDIGYIDDEGYVFINGRKDEILNVSGKKASAVEIRELLLKMDSIEDAVVLQDPEAKHVTAYVVLARPVKKNEIIRFCQERLSAYKVPKVLHIVKEIPKNRSGKILKKYLIGD